MRWLLLRRDLALKRNFIMALKSINHSRYYRRPSLPEQGLMYPACMNSTMLSALDAEATICVPLGLQKQYVFAGVNSAGARIVVDSVEEMDDLMEVAKRWKSPTGRISILLRLRPAFSHTSRFGMSSREVSAVLQKLETCNPLKSMASISILVATRPYPGLTLFDTLPLIACARSLGHSHALSISGRIARSVCRGNCYKAWLSSQTQENYRTRRVPDAFYPYGGDINAEHWLTQFLGGAGLRVKSLRCINR